MNRMNSLDKRNILLHSDTKNITWLSLFIDLSSIAIGDNLIGIFPAIEVITYHSITYLADLSKL